MCALKMSRILVPTDFSDTSRKALEYAVGLAEAFRAKIVLLHVLDTRVVTNVYHIHQLDPDSARVQMRRSAEEAMEKALATDVARNVTLSARYVEGIPAVEVKREAEESGADLIVMGTHGETGLAHLLYGSTADGVLRGAPCAVLTVKP